MSIKEEYFIKEDLVMLVNHLVIDKYLNNGGNYKEDSFKA